MLVCLRLLLLVGVLVSFGGCSSPQDPGDGAGSSVVSVAIDQGESVAVEVADSLSLSATVVVTGGATDAVVWSASCGGVSGSGLTVEYSAPVEVSDCVVTVTSAVDASVSASAIVYVRAVPEARYEGADPVGLEVNELGRVAVVSSAGDRRFDVRAEDAAGVAAAGAVVSYEEFGSVALIRAVGPNASGVAVHLHDLSVGVDGASDGVEASAFKSIGVLLVLAVSGAAWNQSRLLYAEVDVTLERVPEVSADDGVVEVCVLPEDFVYLLLTSAAAQEKEIESLKVLGKAVLKTVALKLLDVPDDVDRVVKVAGAVSDLGHLATARPGPLIEDMRTYAYSALEVPGFSGDEYLEVTFLGFRRLPGVSGGATWSAAVITGAGCDPLSYVSETGTVEFTSSMTDVTPWGDAPVTVRIDPPEAAVEVYLYQHGVHSQTGGEYLRRYPPVETDGSGYAQFRVPYNGVGIRSLRAVVPARHVSATAEVSWSLGTVRDMSPEIFNVEVVGYQGVLGERVALEYQVGERDGLISCEVDWREGRGWEPFDCPSAGLFGGHVIQTVRVVEHVYSKTGLFRPAIRFTNTSGFVSEAFAVLSVTEPPVNSPPVIESVLHDGERLIWRFSDDDLLDPHRCHLLECNGPGCLVTGAASGVRSLWWSDFQPHLKVVWEERACTRSGNAWISLSSDADGFIFVVTDGVARDEASVFLGSPLPVMVTITPDAATLGVNESRVFQADVTGANDGSVEWAATCGSIDDNGNTATYTAPSTAGECVVTATSVADGGVSDSAVVTVVPDVVDVGGLALSVRNVDGLLRSAVSVTLEGAGGTFVEVSGADGVARFEDVPVGSYAAQVWLEYASDQYPLRDEYWGSRSVEVVADTTSEASFTRDMPWGGGGLTFASEVEVGTEVSISTDVVNPDGRLVALRVIVDRSDCVEIGCLGPEGVAGAPSTGDRLSVAVTPSGVGTYNFYLALETAVGDDRFVTDQLDGFQFSFESLSADEPVEVSVTPNAVTLPVNDTQSFTATVTGATDTGVTWSATCGSISGSGTTVTYTAPSAAGECLVTATSVADGVMWDQATVTVIEETIADVTFISVSGGATFTLALDEQGRAWGWGTRSNGVIGGGSSSGSTSVPTLALMPPDVAFTQVSAGDFHSVALDSTGRAWAWGRNSSGQLGDGTDTTRLEPVLVRMPLEVVFTSVAAGGSYSLALDQDGNAWAWGDNGYGQLGAGITDSMVNEPTRVQMPAGVYFVAVTAGRRHSLTIDQNGRGWGWGDNYLGKLGNGVLTGTYREPVLVTMEAGVAFVDVSAGDSHSLAIDASGRVWAWGSGPLGTGDSYTTVPRELGLREDLTIRTVSAGGGQSLALSDDGQAYAWGRNSDGELGDTTTQSRLLPVLVNQPAGVSFATISAGWSHSLSLDEHGFAWAWGRNVAGELGYETDGYYSTSPEPVSVP